MLPWLAPMASYAQRWFTVPMPLARNILRALEFMRVFVITSASRTNAPYPYQPFKLDTSSQNRISEFQVAIINGGVRYEYLTLFRADNRTR
jgi:hypothetical protein